MTRRVDPSTPPGSLTDSAAVRRVWIVACLVAGLATLPVLSGCERIKRKMGMDECSLVHSIGPAYTDPDALGKIIQLPAKPLRVVWSRGPVGGPPDGANLPGRGDWEVLALLEFAEPDANKLTDSGRGEVMEIEVPATAWMANELGLPPPYPLKPGECREQMMKISGFGYDASPFVQYFLEPVALVKVPESSYFALWLSTRPPEKKGSAR